jgi:hypothetical protein
MVIAAVVGGGLLQNPVASVAGAEGVPSLKTTIRDVLVQERPGSYISGRRIVNAARTPVRLRRTPRNPLAGFEAPTARITRDGRTLAYDSWTHERHIDRRQTFETQGINTG